MKHRLNLAALLLASGLACTAQAETVYKYRMPDGRIVYTGEVLRNATLLDTLRDPPPPKAPDAATQQRLEREKARAAASPDRTAALEAADAEVKSAVRGLAEAKARQESGAEPEEGERVGTARGAPLGRARDEYIARQGRLQEAVDAAQKRLDRAYEALNALR